MGKRLYTDIEIRGVVYPTVQAAAATFGLTANNIRRHVKNGTLHRCGTGENHVEPMPVRIRGVVYPNARAAAAALNVTPSAIYQAMRTGNADRVGLPHKPPAHRSRPFVIGGLRFPSMRAASLALGFRGEYVAQVLKKNSKAGRQRLLAAAMRYAHERNRSRAPA